MAGNAADALKQVIADKGAANIIVATGASQFDTPGFHCPRGCFEQVLAFHSTNHWHGQQTSPNFVKYLQERFADKVPLKKMHFVRGDADDIEAETKRLDELISAVEIDVALIGIGENAHIAFNDPPADFETKTLSGCDAR